MTDESDDARDAYLAIESGNAMLAEWFHELDRESEFAMAPNGVHDEYWQPIHDAIKDDLTNKDLWTEHAFITRWGTAEELGMKLADLEALLAWWSERENEFHVAVVTRLEAARDRLRDLRDLGKRVEYTLRLRGCVFNPTSRLLVEVEPAKRGPRRSLLSQAVTKAFDELVVGSGRAAKNTEAIRLEIGALLADKFDPILLDPSPGGKLHSALNAHLNADRSRTKKRKRDTGRTG